MLSLLSDLEKDDVVKAFRLIDEVLLLAPDRSPHPEPLVAGRFRIEIDPADTSISIVRVFEGRSLLLTIHREPVPNKRLVASTTEVTCEWRCTRSGPRRRLAEIALIALGLLDLRMHHEMPFLIWDRNVGERWPPGVKLVATKTGATFIEPTSD